MSTVEIQIRDVGNGVQLVGRLASPCARLVEPTPAMIVGSYLAANAERLAAESWAWYAAQRVAKKTTWLPASIGQPDAAYPRRSFHD